MKLTYTSVNGYLIPNLTYKSGEQMKQLGKYGFLRRDYLKNHRNSLYQVMLLQDSIGEHLLEVDKAARELNQSLQQSNDDLRNKNGLMSRSEQEQLEKEIKDVRDRNSKLQVQVNKSSVEAIDEACKKQKETEKQLYLSKRQAEQNRKKAQKEMQKLKKEIKLQSEKIKEIKIFCGIGYAMAIIFVCYIMGTYFL